VIDFLLWFVINFLMAYILVFPDQHSYDRASEALAQVQTPFEVVPVPRFCTGIAAPALRVTGAIHELSHNLRSQGIALSGVLPYRPFLRDIPEADPPDARWNHILGRLHLASIRPSQTDPLKLRIEVVPENSLKPLIPMMARLIRGGAYRYEVPLLVFEEEHRLLAVSGDEIVICRADDLLDAWIMLRCMIELILSAWDHRLTLQPETDPRNGIGAIEMFKRLPGTNCGKCAYGNCMEFAMMLFRGKCGMEHCAWLAQDEGKEHRESLRWLLRAIGLAPEENESRLTASPEPGHGTQRGVPESPPEAEEIAPGK
jgi:ArsR family metal-binding transcriptional regulator